MLKLFTLLNITGLFLFKMFFITDVVVTQELPATMQAGSEVRVTVMIDKDKLTGFAKLQIDLPEGLSASAIETKGASFTFAEGKAKFIWMALPAAPRFEISYTLTAAANASGSMPITGKFSYIEDNERKTKDLASSTVIITNEAAAQDNSVTPNVDVAAQPPAEQVTPAVQPAVETAAPPPAEKTNDVASSAPTTPENTQPAATPGLQIAPQQGAGNVSSQRVITPVTENEMLVEVTVNKGDLRGFGKLQETIPAGFTALEKNSAEAIFTTQDRVVKFVWLNLPAKSELKVVYKLRGSGVPEAEYTVNGEFGYLLNDETQKAVTGTTAFWTGAKALEQIAAMNAQNNTGQTAQNNTQNTGSQTTQQSTQENTTASTQQKTKPKAHIGGPETGVSYKVQISAAHREVGASYFAERHHYTGEFSIEHHNGWIKYVTGRFENYRGARDQRQSYVDGGYNFPGPFVTAYNNGDRITVQEALMISNQKWNQ